MECTLFSIWRNNAAWQPNRHKVINSYKQRGLLLYIMPTTDDVDVDDGDDDDNNDDGNDDWTNIHTTYRTIASAVAAIASATTTTKTNNN